MIDSDKLGFYINHDTKRFVKIEYEVDDFYLILSGNLGQRISGLTRAQDSGIKGVIAKLITSGYVHIYQRNIDLKEKLDSQLAAKASERKNKL